MASTLAPCMVVSLKLSFELGKNYQYKLKRNKELKSKHTIHLALHTLSQMANNRPLHLYKTKQDNLYLLSTKL